MNSIGKKEEPMKKIEKLTSVILLLLATLFISPKTGAQTLIENPELDRRVEKFLASGRWQDMNVPTSDGKLLYDLIIKGQYTRALEIGTSTGHSGIYIAWALSKTGGKLITIDIDERRHKEALKNFKEAGLSDYIDARLADAAGRRHRAAQQGLARLPERREGLRRAARGTGRFRERRTCQTLHHTRYGNRSR